MEEISPEIILLGGLVFWLISSLVIAYKWRHLDDHPPMR